MKDDFSQVLSLSKDENVKIGQEFKNLLHKNFVLGQTDYVCLNGTLSDGHEKITKSQRYYQAHKEWYLLSNNVGMLLAQAMESKADLLDAKDALKNAKTAAQKLRCKSKKMIAEMKIESARITISDQIRMIRSYRKFIEEVGPEVEAKYPCGIEQAESDNWRAVAKYRAVKKGFGFNEPMNNLPLPMDEKAKFALENGIPEMAAWFLSENQEGLTEYKGNIEHFLQDKLKGIDNVKSLLPKIR